MCVLPVAMGDWIYGEWMEMEPAWERSLEVMLLGSNQVSEEAETNHTAWRVDTGILTGCEVGDKCWHRPA